MRPLPVQALAALLLVAHAVLASCPNSCRGRGSCLDDDRCHCFHPWFGPDCSERRCPKGLAFASIGTRTQRVLGRPHLLKAAAASQNVLKAVMPLRYGLWRDLHAEVEIVEVMARAEGLLRFRIFDPGAAFDHEEVHAFNASSGALVSASNALELTAGKTRSGVLVYVDESLVTAPQDMTPGDRYLVNISAAGGGTFVSSRHSSMHQPLECSGAGTCNRETGACACQQGFTGDACSRLDCPGKCSGHGVCQTLRQFLDDGSRVYDGYDADKLLTCSCDKGFRGADCSLRECPSGADPLGGPGGAQGRDCSGRGVCDYATGLCRCADGFWGIRCESQTNFL